MRSGAVNTMRRPAGSTRSEARRARVLRTKVTGREEPAWSTAMASGSGGAGLGAAARPSDSMRSNNEGDVMNEQEGDATLKEKGRQVLGEILGESYLAKRDATNNDFWGP